MSDEVNPITLSVMMNRFVAAAKEMTLALEHTAWTSIIALAHDFSCAIYDAKRRQVAVFEALPLHTASMHITLQTLADQTEDEIVDGDVFLMNDPHRGNTHIGDLVTACPVFAEGTLAFWVVTKAHQLDTGAMIPSSVTPLARDVWQEGLAIPPVRLYRAGEEQRDVLRMYLNNVRYPDLLKGDLMAQLGSCWTGKRAVAEIIKHYGLTEVETYVEEMLSYASRRTSQAITEMPDGVYEAVGWLDSDGTDRVDIPLRVQVEIREDRVRVDYSGSAEQGAGGMNGTLATMQGAGSIPVLMTLDPDIPHNQGCIDHVEVSAEHGSICWAKHPASTSAATLVPSDLMQDLVQKALAEAVPDSVVAGTARGANIPSMAGVHPDSGQPWAVMLFNNLGGGGASNRSDGWPMIGTIGAWGGLKTLSVEQLELLNPLHVEHWEIESDSAGPGEFNGGVGNRLVIRPLTSEISSVEFGDGRANPPHGAVGGMAGSGGGSYVEHEDGSRTYLSAANEVSIRPGERWVGVSSGGGGYGSPCDRPTESVVADVRDGIVSRNQARAVYGVVLDDAYTVDGEATTVERCRLADAGVDSAASATSPTTPAASTWLQEHLREQDEYLLNPRLS